MFRFHRVFFVTFHPSYEVYTELEEAVVQAKQDWLDDLSQDYGMDFSDQLLYHRGGEM